MDDETVIPPKEVADSLEALRAVRNRAHCHQNVGTLRAISAGCGTEPKPQGGAATKAVISIKPPKPRLSALAP